MIIIDSCTLAYDETEVHLFIETECGECIKVGDMITIPMNDHTTEKRVIEAIFRSENDVWRNKNRLDQLSDGARGLCIVRDIHSGCIHTIHSPYDDDPTEGVCGTECESETEAKIIYS